MWSENAKYTIRVLEDPLTDAYILDEIVNDYDEARRYYIWRAAKHQNLSYKSALILIESNNYIIRQALASNPNIILDLLERLCNDPSYIVRSAAVSNPNATETMRRKFLMATRNMTLEQMAQAQDPDFTLPLN
jgi:hypothetical protein